MKKVIFSILVFLLAMAFAVSVYAWPAVYPTGTTLYKPDKAFNGYTLFTPLGDGGAKRKGVEPYEKPATMYLINMNGDVVHTWKLPFGAHHGVLQPNGNLVAICADAKKLPGRPGQPPFGIGGSMGWLYELDWNGKVVFKHFDPTMHHDFDKKPNGNYVYLGWEQVPKALQKKIRGGIKGTEHKGGVMWGTTIIEVNPKGEVVWKWGAIKHWDPKIDVMGPTYARNEWGHANSVDVMEDGNVVFDAKHTDTVYIIDKKTGKVKWRWGAIAYLDKETGQIEYKTGKKVVNALGGQHDAHEIQPGLPGAGNIMIYDNGMYNDQSRAVEVDPKTGKVVWQELGRVFTRAHFSSFISGAERMPNGNTVICSGGNGRFFEVTKDHELVWEYINPYTYPFFDGACFRAHRYGPDYCSQFKKLPPAKGPPVLPIDVSTYRVPAAARPKKPGPPPPKH